MLQYLLSVFITTLPAVRAVRDVLLQTDYSRELK